MAAGAAALALAGSPAWAATEGKQDVRVVNTAAEAVPVKLDSQANVVRAGDRTELVVFTTLHPINTTTGDLDVSAYRQVRVSWECAFSCSGMIFIYAGDGSFSMPLERIESSDVGSFGSRIYAVPGLTLEVKYSTTDPIEDAIHVMVFGRNN
jgi:hypothetical protein